MTSTRPTLTETAPSRMKGEESTATRIVGIVGWCLVVVGCAFIIANRSFETPRLFGEPVGWVFTFVGLTLAFVHLATETDEFLRRVLGAAGGLLVLGGACWGIYLALKGKSWGIGLVPAIPGAFMAALYGRRESDQSLRAAALYSLGGLGLALVVIGVFAALGQAVAAALGTNINPIWFAGRWVPAIGIGLVLTLLFLGCAGSRDDVARYAAMALGIVGLVAIVAAALLSAIPAALHDWREVPKHSEHLIALLGGLLLFAVALAAMMVLGKPKEGEAPTDSHKTIRSWGRIGAVAGVLLMILGAIRYVAPNILINAGWAATTPKPFLFPNGMVLMVVGLISIIISVGFWSEGRLVVMTRREFATFFLSPIAYCVMFGFLMMAALNYLSFALQIDFYGRNQQPMEEPIVQGNIVTILTVVAVMAAVPLLTMRLFSEEKRSGTLEVLLTVPVSDWLVILSKFLATWIFFNLLWVPWWLFLLALRLESGQDFDFRPLLGFWVVLAVSGAAFVAMGLFFSSLSRDQIIAAVLSFMGMMILVGIFLIDRMVRGNDSLTVAFKSVIRAVSFIQMWINATDGKLYVRDLLVESSLAVFWLFLTAKVLEMRRWS